LELYGSERGRNEKDDDGFEGGVSSSAANGIGQTAATENRVLSFVHIAEENFLLVVLLSSEANLMVYYSTGAKLSRNGAVSIPQLFPNQKVPFKNFKLRFSILLMSLKLVNELYRYFPKSCPAHLLLLRSRRMPLLWPCSWPTLTIFC
jgi:hypothetical protein